MTLKSHTIIVLLFGLLMIYGCKKYLDAKPDKKLAIITNLQDLQSLMDFNVSINNDDPGSLEAVTDNYYVTNADYSYQTDDLKNLYIWDRAYIFESNSPENDWARCYNKVYIANTVLFNLDKVERTPNDQYDWNNVKGQALYLRARGFLLAVSMWSLAYDEASASKDLGIPLRLTPDFNEQSVRSTVKETYDRIVSDLKESIALLPVTPIHVLRSSRPAALSLLARTYLFMREYDSCYKYSNLCLQLKSDLLNYNNVNVSASSPFSPYKFGLNPEIIMQQRFAAPSLIINDICKMDSILYQSFSPDDLRTTVFFGSNGDGSYKFKGSYYGSSAILFDGTATDEVFLMRAECLARQGNISAAMDDLNHLLQNRWKANTFIPFVAADQNDAISQILAERRKELVMRGIRWMDIKRLNKEGANIILKRIVNGQTYTLPPNDLRYALAIPEDIISLSGIQQNPR